jgi:hypothetical protein
MLGPGAKTAARDERDAWKRLQIDATAAGALTSGVVGIAAVAIGAAAAVTAPPLLVAGAMAWWAQRKLVTIERKIEDPPRLDFGKPSVVAPHPVHREAFGSDPLEQVAFQFLRDLSSAIALEEAMIVADERRQGAQLLRRSDEAAAHAAEVTGLMESLWVRTEALRGIARELGRHLRRHPLSKLEVAWADVERNGPFVDMLPADVQARLFRAGIDVEWLSRDVEVSGVTREPLGRLAAATNAAVQKSLDFAGTARAEMRGAEHELDDNEDYADGGGERG